MLIDKLSWVQHEGVFLVAAILGWGAVASAWACRCSPAENGKQTRRGACLPARPPAGAIYSVHAQPGGTRFATGGFDQKVKVWNLAAALDAALEAQPDTPKLLAVLSEHTRVVNVVRFSADGRLLASGSDDAAVIIYHLLPGPGGGSLGSTAANVENWRPKTMLRGHATNVADLAWSPDSARLATASMDGTIMVWDAASGHRIATLTAHTSFVKGVQWDPVGSYLASQVGGAGRAGREWRGSGQGWRVLRTAQCTRWGGSCSTCGRGGLPCECPPLHAARAAPQADDRTVRVHSASDWSLLATIEAPYRRMITDTFATRLAFSPDGSALLTGNSFQRGNHCALVVPREKWGEPGEYLFLAGHTGGWAGGWVGERAGGLLLVGSGASERA